MNSENLWGGAPEDFIDNLSVNCVLLGFHEGTMKILLMRFDGYDKWMLPGGFVLKSENVDDAATRMLEDRVGLNDVELIQFYTFGNKNRTSLHENEDLLDKVEKKDAFLDASWFVKRYISVGYLAFLEYSKVQIISNQFSELKWCHIHEIPKLYSDHNYMIDKSREHIRKHISSIPIGLNLLTEKFTMTELRTIYESILGEKMDRRNFQRKMLSTGYILKTNEMSIRPGIKPANLFTFDLDKYKKGNSGF